MCKICLGATGEEIHLSTNHLEPSLCSVDSLGPLVGL